MGSFQCRRRTLCGEKIGELVDRGISKPRVVETQCHDCAPAAGRKTQRKIGFELADKLGDAPLPPARGAPEVPFATGSLGHGFGLASGLALGFRLQGHAGRVFCLTSDGEWNEGSSWEALIFATHHRLANLTVVIDANGLQGFGSTREVADIEPLADKFRAFGADVEEVDGHDPVALRHALSVTGDGLRVIVARTVKGHGVSFMENRMEWHYLPLTDAQYAQAIAEIDAREAAFSDARDGIAR